MFEKDYIFLIFVILLFTCLFCWGCDLDNGIETFTRVQNLNKIPKIIHQTAPSDMKKWPKKWIECQKSWKRCFPEGEWIHIMWTDEDLDQLIRIEFPFFYKTFKGYPKQIQRVDMARYFILYKYGGIYADMDFECMRNFYNTLNQKNVCIAESPYKENENLHNSLMCSPPSHPFWEQVFKEAELTKNISNVLTSTGPRLVDRAYNAYPNKEKVTILPEKLYNPSKNSADFNNPMVYCKHYLTTVWNNPSNPLYT
jgi:mannosyltransferase OCH1-like enzyme